MLVDMRKKYEEYRQKEPGLLGQELAFEVRSWRDCLQMWIFVSRTCLDNGILANLSAQTAPAVSSTCTAGIVLKSLRPSGGQMAVLCRVAVCSRSCGCLCPAGPGQRGGRRGRGGVLPQHAQPRRADVEPARLPQCAAQDAHNLRLVSHARLSVMPDACYWSAI